MNLLLLLNFLNTFKLEKNVDSKNDRIWKGGKLTREVENKWKELFIQASKGDKASYEKFLTEIDHYLDFFCRKYLYNESQLQDCKQECLLAIHKAKHTYNPEKPFGPWFFTIARHKITDQFRTSKKRQSREVLDANYDVVESENLASFNLDKAVSKLLSNITSTYVDTFRLTKIEGKSISKTAKILKISESAVKVRVYRATKEIKALIKKDFSLILLFICNFLRFLT